MAFGKLIIRTESGDYREVELTNPTTSVGRQPGNEIVLNTSAVSRYHAQFEVAEGRVYLVDLGTVNGTFVNDKQIEPNSRVPLSEGDAIVMGDVMLKFLPPEARPLKNIELTPTAVPVEAAGLPFRLVLDAPNQPVAPSARLQLALIIDNTGNTANTYTIELGGMEAEWAKPNRREVQLDPGESTEVMIAVRPPRTTKTLPGLYALTVRVALKSDPTQALEAVREIEVVGYAALAMAVQEGKQNGLHHLAAQNQGSVPLDLQLGGYQRENLLRYHFEPPRLHLEPGQTEQVTLNVRPRKNSLFSPPQTVDFAIVARSLDKAGYQAPIQAYYTLKPSWTGWLIRVGLPLLLGGLLLLGFVAGAFFFLSDAPLPFGVGSRAEAVASTTPDNPTADPALAAPPEGPTPSVIPTPMAAILEFSASPTEVTYRTDGNVTLSWRVENQVSVSISDENGAQLPLSANDLSTGRYEIPIADLEWGEHTYQLRIFGDDNEPRSQLVTITVNSLRCTVDLEEAAVFTRPNDLSASAPDFESNDLVILGRNEEGGWLWVGYNDLSAPEWNDEGWVQREQVDCPPGTPFDRYILVDAEGNPLPPGGVGALTPGSGETQTPGASDAAGDDGAASAPGE
jgi:pSer/pThr/pTyr-binding forkhead associated (FHA) protein